MGEFAINICFYTSDIYEAGGIGRVTSLIAGKLSEENNVFVLSLTASDKAMTRISENISVEVQFEGRISIRKHFCSCVKKTRAYIIRNQIDVLICSSEMLAPICALAVAGIKTQYFAWLHANIDIVAEYKLQGLCRMIAVKTAKKIIVLTEEMKEKYANRYHSINVSVIENPIDEQLIKPVKYARESKRIISVGRLVPAKNYEMLVDVANIVLKKHQDWSWDIYGDGQLRKQLQNRINQSGLTAWLHLRGAVDDIYDRYGDYSFLVMTSSYEGFPMVLLEGMANGLPLVAFDVTTGPKYIIHNNENGFLVPEISAKKMADVVEELIENKQKRLTMSMAAMKRREEFSVDSVLTKWESLLKSI